MLSLFFLGGLPFAGVFCAYNAAAYGHPLVTGYVATGHQNLVMLGDFTVRFHHYIYWLTVTMSPLPLLGWVGVALNRNVKLRDRALLISWFGVFLLFYSCYFHYEEWWYTRFLLPGMPALILGTLLVVRDLGKLIERSAVGRRGVWLRRAAVIILIGIVLGFERQELRAILLAQSRGAAYGPCRFPAAKSDRSPSEAGAAGCDGDERRDQVLYGPAHRAL